MLPFSGRSSCNGSCLRCVALQDVNTGRVLVLKRSSLQGHEGRVVYEKEASVMRTLAHPNIVQVGWRGKECAAVEILWCA